MLSILNREHYLADCETKRTTPLCQATAAIPFLIQFPQHGFTVFLGRAGTSYRFVCILPQGVVGISCKSSNMCLC